MSKTGGPAFPTIVKDITIEPDPRFGWGTITGMTMRDYFAAATISSYLADPPADASYDDIAEKTYRMADAMLRERAK